MSNKKKDFQVDVATYADVKKIAEAAFLTPMPDGFGQAENEVVWGPPICFHGPPGGGKTSFFRWLARRYNLTPNFVNMKPGARGEGNVGVTPVAVHSDKHGKTVLQFPPPEELLNAFPNGKGIVLVDDLAAGMTPTLQAAYLDVLQERLIGTHKFRGGVRIFGATNSVEDSAGGHDIAPAVANRIGHLPWADAPGSELGLHLQTRVGFGRGFDHEDRIDLERREQEVLAAFPDAWARSSMLFAGFVTANPTMARVQPPPGDPSLSQAWASPRSVEMAAVMYAGGLVHGLAAGDLTAAVSAFVGSSWATQFDAYAVRADLPDPREVLISFAKGEPVFTHSRTRMDRTEVVIRACVALVMPKNCQDRQRLVTALYGFLANLADECADRIRPQLTNLWSAGLLDHGNPAASRLLALVQPVSAQATAAKAVLQGRKK